MIAEALALASEHEEIVANFKTGTATQWDIARLKEVRKKIGKNYLTNDIKSKKYSRNDKCPCLSGKKFKKCCIKLSNLSLQNTW